METEERIPEPANPNMVQERAEQIILRARRKDSEEIIKKLKEQAKKENLTFYDIYLRGEW